MIPVRFQDRFEGDSGVDIASQEIDAVYPDGERRRVVLRLGAPFVREGRVYIRSELEHLDRTDGPLGGSEAFDALLVGIAWIVGRLQIFSEKHGCVYHWPDSKEVFDHAVYFNTLRLLKNKE